jgi:hypothetical protein
VLGSSLMIAVCLAAASFQFATVSVRYVSSIESLVQLAETDVLVLAVSRSLF